MNLQLQSITSLPSEAKGEKFRDEQQSFQEKSPPHYDSNQKCSSNL